MQSDFFFQAEDKNSGDDNANKDNEMDCNQKEKIQKCWRGQGHKNQDTHPSIK